MRFRGLINFRGLPAIARHARVIALPPRHPALDGRNSMSHSLPSRAQIVLCLHPNLALDEPHPCQARESVREAESASPRLTRTYQNLSPLQSTLRLHPLAVSVDGQAESIHR